MTKYLIIKGNTRTGEREVWHTYDSETSAWDFVRFNNTYCAPWEGFSVEAVEVEADEG